MTTVQGVFKVTEMTDSKEDFESGFVEILELNRCLFRFFLIIASEHFFESTWEPLVPLREVDHGRPVDFESCDSDVFGLGAILWWWW